MCTAYIVIRSQSQSVELGHNRYNKSTDKLVIHNVILNWELRLGYLHLEREQHNDPPPEIHTTRMLFNARCNADINDVV